MEIIEFSGQLFEVHNLSNPEDIIDEALRVAHDYQMSLNSKAIENVKQCSYCGHSMPDGGEVGFVDDGVAYSFCNYDCYGKFTQGKP